jgi:Skp family chaperone for outer membrane proteins
MNKLLRTLLALTLPFCALATQADQRIAVVNLRSVFDGYYKTKAADAALKERAGEFDKEKKALLEQYQKLSGEYKQAVEDANNQAISAEEREKRKKTAEGKLVEAREMEQTITQFDRQAETSLGEQERRVRTKLLEEIQVVIEAKAKAGKFTLVLDTAAESRNRTPIILFTAGEADLTDPVLTELNSTAPPGFLEPGKK